MYKSHCRQIAENKSRTASLHRQRPQPAARLSSLSGTIKDSRVLIAAPVCCQSSTGQGEEEDGQVEGLVQVEVPVVGVEGIQLGRRRVERGAGLLQEQVCAGWLEEEPGWEVVCKEEE